MRKLKADVLDGAEPLSKALTCILKSGTVVVVTNKGRYYGLIDDRDIRGVNNPSKAKAINAAVRAPSLGEESGVEDAMRAFLAGHFKAIPVIENRKIRGVVTRADVMDGMVKARMVPKTNVAALMATPLYTIDSGEKIGVAKGLMKKLGVHHLGVTRNEKVVGNLSTFDLSMMLVKRKERPRFMLTSEIANPDDRLVRDFMRERLVTVRPGDSLDKAVGIMAKENLSKLTVMEGSQAIGVLTAVDVMKFVLSLVTSGPSVFISGLPEDDMFYYRDIKESVKGTLKRYTSTFELGDVNIHFKKGKSTYQMGTKLEIEHGVVVVHSEGYNLKRVIARNLSEIKRLLDKRKNYKKDKRIHNTTGNLL
jgi:CBS domain-containing protein